MASRSVSHGVGSGGLASCDIRLGVVSITLFYSHETKVCEAENPGARLTTPAGRTAPGSLSFYRYPARCARRSPRPPWPASGPGSRVRNEGEGWAKDSFQTICHVAMR